MIEWLDTLQEALKPYPWAYSAIVAGVLILVAFLVNWITKRILLRGLQRLLSLGAGLEDIVFGCHRFSVLHVEHFRTGIPHTLGGLGDSGALLLPGGCLLLCQIGFRVEILLVDRVFARVARCGDAAGC